MAEPIARADSAHRKRLAVATIITLAIGGWGIRFLALRVRALGDLALEAPEAAVAQYLALARWVLAIPAVGLAICGLLLVRLGLRARATSTYPPPGSRLLADQPIVTGKDARKRATVTAAVGLLAVVGAVVLPYMVYLRLVAVLAAGS